MELSQSSDKYKATAVTIVFHGLLLLLFILYKIITPLPAYPEDGGGGLGVELNFGNSADGMGMMNPEELSSAGKPITFKTSLISMTHYSKEPGKPAQTGKQSWIHNLIFTVRTWLL